MLTHLSLTPTFGLGDRLGLATPGHIAAVRGTKFAPIFAIAPGFFVGEQNRRLLLNEDGTLTARGQSIIAHNPDEPLRDPGRFARCDNVANLCCVLFRDRNRDSHRRRILGILWRVKNHHTIRDLHFLIARACYLQE